MIYKSGDLELKLNIDPNGIYYLAGPQMAELSKKDRLFCRSKSI